LTKSAPLFIGGLLIGRRLTDLVGPGPSLLIIFAVPMVIGAFIGDCVGKRRGYRPFM